MGIKVEEILQELAESEPTAQTSKRKTDKHILTPNRITDDKPSQQLFSKQMTAIYHYWNKWIGHTEELK